MRTERASFLVMAVFAVFFIMASVTSLVDKSPVSDEAAHHLPPGYVYLMSGDFVFATDSPPLARLLGASPMLLMEIDMPRNRDFWAGDDRAEFSREFLYSLNRDDFFRILYPGRLTMVLLAVFGGIYLFRWVSRNLGARAALISSAVYFLSPNITAHARFVTTDIAATVFIMCSTLSFWELFEKPDTRRSVFAGLFLALALLSKYSALLLVPVFAVMAVYRCFRGKGSSRAMGLFFLVAFMFLWAGYMFETKPLLEGVLRPEGKEAFFRDFMNKIPIVRNLDPETLLYGVPVPLRSFIIGVMGVLKHGEAGARTFFMGEWSRSGNPLYYFTAFLIKTPIPTLILLPMGFCVAVARRATRGFGVYLSGIAVLFVVTASASDLQLGLRYILPVYPLVFVLGALALDRFFSMSRRIKGAGAVLLIWLVAVNLMIWPDYLSYFNVFAGGPSNGYKYLRDSNIDWGQDLPALKKYMDSEGIDKVKLSYWGEGDPSIYGIEYEIPSDEGSISPAGGVYAISVNNLEAFSWTAGRLPDARAGYSINIYDLRENR